MIELLYVDSTDVDQIGYDPDCSEIHVVFKKSGYYIYSGCSDELFARFRDSSSKGRFLDAEIKKMGFPYRKV